MMIHDLLSPNDAARVLGVTEAALSRFRYEHRGPVFVRVGKLVRYREADLAAWLEANSVQPKVKEAA
jgi:predicted transcriptional regulator